MENTIKKTLYLVLLSLGFIIILIYSKKVLIPIVFAILIWFIILISKKFLEKIKIFNYKIPNFLQNIISIIFVFTLIFLISSLVAQNANEFSKVLPQYKDNITHQIDKISNYTNINITESFQKYFETINFKKIIYTSVSFLTDMLSTLFLILFYVIFLSMEKKYFEKKLKASIKNKNALLKIENILSKISYSIQRYLYLKTSVSFMTALLAYIILTIIGVDFAFLWSFLIFIFNFLPNIGSIFSTIFPTIIAFIQFGSYTEGVIVLVLISTIQLIIGNVIEPKLIGNSLNLSSFVVILSLVIWGSIWGIAGMFLSIPLMVILMIILSNFDKTKPIAIWLSATGEVSKVKGIENIK